MKEVILSKKKFVELLKELDDLNERRPEVLKQLNDARLLGDLSENAEYIEYEEVEGDNENEGEEQDVNNINNDNNMGNGEQNNNEGKK